MENNINVQAIARDSIHKVEYFDFTKMFFSDRVAYKKLTNKAKAPYIYAISRTLAIKFPKLMHELRSISSVSVLDALHNQFVSNKIPGFVFTKTAKGNTKISGILTEYPKETLIQFIEINNIEYKSLILMSEIIPEETKEKLDAFVLQLKEQSSSKQTKARKTKKK